jgi:hypothetical protein
MWRVADVDKSEEKNVPPSDAVPVGTAISDE